MPAVQLSRLKLQAAEVCEAAGNPAAFLRSLHGLFGQYADRTYRAGKSGRPPSLLPHYNIPRPVMRQIQTELERVFQKSPDYALPLADILWQDGGLETRLLAARILDQVEPEPPEPILERLAVWARPEEDPELLEALLSFGNSNLRARKPDLWLTLIARWLDDPSQPVQGMGLKALLSLVRDPTFINIPAVYRLLDPILKAAPSGLTGDLLAVLENLAERSPAETAFFLRQLISSGSEGSLARIVRKCLPFFSGSQLEGLKEALRAG